MAAKSVRTGAFGARGQAFHDKITAAFTLSEAESELFAEVCRILDEIDGLNTAVKRDGITVGGSQGQVRVHPALGEVRQHRLALGRLLAQLSLPDEAGAGLASPVSARARKAAQARWNVGA